jgi:hypothetical protein
MRKRKTEIKRENEILEFVFTSESSECGFIILAPNKVPKTEKK